MTLPRYSSNNKLISAAVQMAWSRLLMQYHSVANGERGMFSRKQTAFDNVNDGSHEVIWQGYILYTGKTTTFRYMYWHNADYPPANGTAHGQLYFNNVLILETDQSTNGINISGTIDLSGVAGLTLTPNTIYPVRLEIWRSGSYSQLQDTKLRGDAQWLGFTYTPTYTAVPTFADAGAGNPDFTYADLNKIPTAIEEIGEVIGMPVVPTAENYRYHVTGSDDPVDVWRGTVHHATDKLRYFLRGGSDISGKGTWRIKVNGVEVANGTLPYSVQGTGVGQLIDITGVADLSAAGLTRGTDYIVTVSIERTGTTQTLDMALEVRQIVEYDDKSVTAPKVWQEGGTFGFADMNWYKSVIDDIHPGSSAATIPLFFEQPAIIESEYKRYYWQHIKQILYYENAGNTTDITYPANTRSLSSSETKQDLSAYNDLLAGDYILMDDAKFATEADV